MRIELKNFKYARFASQETECFRATVYINGKRYGEVHNEGTGGCDLYSPASIYTTIKKFTDGLPPRYLGGRPVPMSPDLLMGDLVNQAVLTKDFVRLFKHSVVVLRNGQVLSVKVPPDLRAKYTAQYVANGENVISTMTPADAAMAVVIAQREKGID
jgi:hypothetical protein